MIKPRFTPEIQAGHLLQAAVYTISLIGAVFTGYTALESSIERQNALFDKRVTLVEQVQQMQSKDDLSWRGEMRSANQSLQTAISQLSREVADLRVAIANKADRK